MIRFLLLNRVSTYFEVGDRKMKNAVWFGVICCALASMSWGAMFPVADAAFQHINPFYFTIIRYLPVVIILVFMLLMTEGKKAFKLEGKGLKIWFYGTMGFTIYNIFIFWGQDLLSHDGVILASIFEALAPILSILFVWLVFKNKPFLFTVLCITGAFIGVVLVVTNGEFSLLFQSARFIPMFILLLAALGWALYTIGGDEFPGWSVLRYSALSCLTGTLTALVVVVSFSLIGMIDVPSASAVWEVKYHMLFMIVFPGLLALLSWNKGVQILKPINAILFINLAPVTTLIIRFFQGYPISVYELTGVTVVCLMIILNNLHQRYQNRKKLRLQQGKEIVA